MLVSVEVGEMSAIAVAVIHFGQEPQGGFHFKDIVDEAAMGAASPVGDDHVGSAAAGNIGAIFDFRNIVRGIFRLTKPVFAHAVERAAEDDFGDESADHFSAAARLYNLETSIALHLVFIGLEEIGTDGCGLDEVTAGAVLRSWSDGPLCCEPNGWEEQEDACDGREDGSRSCAQWLFLAGNDATNQDCTSVRVILLQF
jgi:hypothetical protein